MDMSAPASAPIAPAVPHADRAFAAFLFDMDGTLISSIESANRAWTRWSQEQGLDPAQVIAIMHGVRTIETMRRLGVADPEREAARITEIEMQDVDDVVALPGATDFLAAIPAGRWAIVTSAPRRLAEARLRAAGIAIPPVFVASEDVERGKPAPDCFLLGAERLGVPSRDCLVFEDTVPGLAAADAAGAAGLAITATHAHPIDVPHPAVRDYRGLGVAADAAGLRLVAR